MDNARPPETQASSNSPVASAEGAPAATRKSRRGLPARAMGFVLGGAALGLGLAMPSCPGQQALQQQVDETGKRETADAQRVQALETQLKAVTSDLTQAKELLSLVGKTVRAQGDAISQLQANVSALAAAKTAKAAPKSSKKKRH